MEPVEQSNGMSRSEWIKQARYECEQSLHHTPKKIIEESKEKYMKPARVDSRFEKKGKERKILPKREKSSLLSNSFSVEVSGEGRSSLEPIKILGIRSVIAVVILAFIITIDIFHIDAGKLNSEFIETSIGDNEGIEKLEKSVSTFAKEKILPVFGIGDKNEGENPEE